MAIIRRYTVAGIELVILSGDDGFVVLENDVPFATCDTAAEAELWLAAKAEAIYEALGD